MSQAVTAPCTCASRYQDQRHGRGVRVHNVGKNDLMKCTVCGNKKGSSVKPSASQAAKGGKKQ